MRLIIALAVAVLATHATARGKAELHCQEERGKTNCVDLANVRVNGDTRAAPMFTRGPKEDTAAPYTLVANCSKAVIILQDHHGAKFDGGLSTAPATSRALYDAICGAARTRSDPKLRGL